MPTTKAEAPSAIEIDGPRAFSYPPTPAPGRRAPGASTRRAKGGDMGFWSRGAATATRDDLRRRVAALKWVHSIDLGGGVVTPGAWGPPAPQIVRALDSIDFRGRRVLDIGCWDGLWSFEAERRGAAEVYATDFVPHRVQ